jgi:hypothetical protein
MQSQQARRRRHRTPEICKTLERLRLRAREKGKKAEGRDLCYAGLSSGNV